ncbi:hypothetical protein FOCC_FOCC006019 [Frankliniella occidentalis]|nr:hypothetical protein FOCC_FOCC006019 [Frankliniella occidentalis]
MGKRKKAPSTRLRSLDTNDSRPKLSTAPSHAPARTIPSPPSIQKTSSNSFQVDAHTKQSFQVSVLTTSRVGKVREESNVKSAKKAVNRSDKGSKANNFEDLRKKVEERRSLKLGSISITKSSKSSSSTSSGPFNSCGTSNSRQPNSMSDIESHQSPPPSVPGTESVEHDSDSPVSAIEEPFDSSSPESTQPHRSSFTLSSMPVISQHTHIGQSLNSSQHVKSTSVTKSAESTTSCSSSVYKGKSAIDDQHSSRSFKSLDSFNERRSNSRSQSACIVGQDNVRSSGESRGVATGRVEGDESNFPALSPNRGVMPNNVNAFNDGDEMLDLHIHGSPLVSQHSGSLDKDSDDEIVPSISQAPHNRSSRFPSDRNSNALTCTSERASAAVGKSTFETTVLQRLFSMEQKIEDISSNQARLSMHLLPTEKYLAKPRNMPGIPLLTLDQLERMEKYNARAIAMKLESTDLTETIQAVKDWLKDAEYRTQTDGTTARSRKSKQSDSSADTYQKQAEKNRPRKRQKKAGASNSYELDDSE